MSLKILVAFPSHLQKNDWYELIWLFDDRRHEMLSLFFKWDADSVGRRPDGSNIPSVVSSNMAGNLQKRKFFFASKIIELNGEFPIAMFDYWRVRNWTVGQWATCTIFIHFPLVPSKENPQGFGVWMNSLRVFGSAVLAGHGQPFLSSTLAKNSKIGRVVDPSSASDRWTTQHRLFWFFLSLLKFLAEYLPILMGSFAKGSNALEFHYPIPTDINILNSMRKSKRGKCIQRLCFRFKQTLILRQSQIDSYINWSFVCNNSKDGFPISWWWTIYE